MELDKKKILGIVIAAVIIVGGSLGYYYGIYLPNKNKDIGGEDPPIDDDDDDDIPEVIDLTGLPDGAAPVGYLAVNDGSNMVANLSLQLIVDGLRNGTFHMVKTEANISGVMINATGFNPLEIFDYCGLHYVNEFNAVASDGYAKTLNWQQFYMGEKYYFKDAIGEETMIAIAANKTWLKTYNAELGNMRVCGGSFTSGQKIKNLVNLTTVNEIEVKVTLNGEDKLFITHTNVSAIVGGNITTYNWGYTDNASGKSWGPANHTGITIASIVESLSIVGDYNVSFISVDGWGAKWKYSKTDIEDGITGKMINDPPTELFHEHKQTILNWEVNGQPLTYASGPFRSICPGQTRDRYQKAVVEIRITQA